MLRLAFVISMCNAANVPLANAAWRIPPPAPIPVLSCFQTRHINLQRPEPLGGQGHRRRLAVSHPAELLLQSNITRRCTVSSLQRTRDGHKDTMFVFKVNSKSKSPMNSNYANTPQVFDNIITLRFAITWCYLYLGGIYWPLSCCSGTELSARKLIQKR